MVSKENSVSQVLRNWQVYSDFVTCFFCIYRVIYLTDLYAGFIKTKITKPINFWKQVILLFRNHLAGPVNLVKLAWTSRSQFFFEKNLFAFYNQPGQISVITFFKLLFQAACLCQLNQTHRSNSSDHKWYESLVCRIFFLLQCLGWCNSWK